MKSKIDQGTDDMMKLAGYFDELGQIILASNFRKFAGELRADLPRKEFIEKCRMIHASLDHGPGRAPDLYFAFDSGKPDLKKTEDYLKTVNVVRSFARTGMLRNMLRLK